MQLNHPKICVKIRIIIINFDRKNYKNPSKIVEIVMEGVCIFLSKKYEWRVA